MCRPGVRGFSEVSIAVALLWAALCPAAWAAHAPAGTTITNTASVHYLSSGSPYSQTASAVLTVAQLVTVSVSWQNTANVSVLPGSVQQSLLFQVANTGNGLDSFTLGESPATPSGATFDPAACQIYFDTAKTGVFNSADVLYTPGVNDPALAASATVNMLLVCNVPGTAADQSLGEMSLAATSRTDSGTPGTVKTGGGVGGVDAIVGLTGGAGNATGIYEVHNVLLGYTKSEAITDPSGGNRPVSGAVIQYILTVTPSGSATANNVVVTDPVPANTTFIPGSILLNGAAVAPNVGDYNITVPGAVTVKLGNVAGSAGPQIVKFEVTIN